MRSFTYARPHDLTQLWREHGPDAAYIAGGTNLVDLMKCGVATPQRVVDIGALPLGGIELDGDKLHVGALATNSDLAAHPLVVRHLPMLAQALLSGASPQLRNLATLGGNLMQRTRCGYFRDIAMPCNKREPGAGCAAMDGSHHGHAVLGTSEHCIATHPSDLAVALVALDAQVSVAGPNGARVVPADAFHLPPGDRPDRETQLAAGELILGAAIPLEAAGAHSCYVKVRERASYAFALASAAVGLDVRDGTIRDARVALGGVATTPWRARAAERVLVGSAPGPAVFGRAADAAAEGARPLRDNAYKVELIRRVVTRALTTLPDAPPPAAPGPLSGEPT
ncbi:FAD binding domain-containing protein [Streptodolium elevatio]